MALTTEIKLYVNKWLQHINLRVDTLTAYKRESSRLEALRQAGHFNEPIFPLPTSFATARYEAVLEEIEDHESRFNDFRGASRNDVAYTFDNDYFSSPDAEVLYSMVRKYCPERIVEIGSGNSTRISKQAILDGELATELISIDPCPRTEVANFADFVYRQRVETMENNDLFERLTEGDILFIDSSHKIKAGNDVTFLYLRVIPKLPPGVLIHIHDVFLPYDYPQEWIVENRWEWNEQYLVQAILALGDDFDVLWPGHYLQRSRADFEEHFPHVRGRTSKSLWLEKR